MYGIASLKQIKNLNDKKKEDAASSRRLWSHVGVLVEPVALHLLREVLHVALQTDAFRSALEHQLRRRGAWGREGTGDTTCQSRLCQPVATGNTTCQSSVCQPVGTELVKTEVDCELILSSIYGVMIGDLAEDVSYIPAM